MESMTLCGSHSPGFARDHAHGDEFHAGFGNAAALGHAVRRILTALADHDERMLLIGLDRKPVTG